MDARLEAMHIRAEGFYDPAKTRVEAMASCLSCHEVFACRWQRNQRRHGCVAERENWTGNARQKHNGNKHGKYTDAAWARMLAKQRETYRNGRLKDNRHPCPECGTPTSNHYRCHQCWQRLEKQGDIDAIMTWNMGESRRVNRPRAKQDWVY